MDEIKDGIKRMGFDAEMAENLSEIVRITRETTIEECVNAARDGFEQAMKEYVLIGPSGMAMQMINSIKALRTYGNHMRSECPALAATPAETLERIAELQYEAGMYQCLYENSQKRLAFLIGDADLTHYEADAESVLSPLRELATNDLADLMKLAGDHRVSSEALGIRLRALWTSNR